MGKSTGFLEIKRMDGGNVPALERIENFDDFHENLSDKDQMAQGARCMECGVPFCQSGLTLNGMASGCPLHNLLPEINDALYHGNWEQAYERLEKTHSFPEFTGYVCPALCEAACTCGLHDLPVATKENERAVIRYAYAHGLVKEETPKTRTGKKVAVIGSGPSGLAVAQLLNRRGHLVTVYEKNDRVGGLLRYGIPNMKLDKRIIDRRVKMMEEAGVTFVTNCQVGVDISMETLKKDFDRVVLCGGAGNPRDITAPGRDAKNILFAVDFLKEVSKTLMDHDYSSEYVKTADFSFGNLKGKKAVVIGGGDTGNDCVGTCVRLGVSGVYQIEMMPKAPDARTASNPWPEWPRVGKTDYGDEEAIAVFGEDPRKYESTVKSFHKDEAGNLCGVTIVKLAGVMDEATGRKKLVPVEGTEEYLEADIVLIAAGFLGSDPKLVEAAGVAVDGRSNVQTAKDAYETSVPGIFTAGDMHRGQSLVVWAIAEGRNAAREIDRSLMGYTSL